MAIQAVKIYESALLLVKRNVAINKSMLEHGKAVPASYLRSKSEAEKVAADLNSAVNKQTNARQYFNFLLNKPLDDEIEVMPETADGPAVDTSAVSVSDREELKVLQTAQTIHASALRMGKLHRMPRVNTFIDLGSQAYDWTYNDQSRYYLFGVQLSLPLFEGFRNQLSIEQARIEIQKTNLSISHTRQHLQMAAHMASNDVASARRNLAAAGEQLRSAQSYFNLVERGYQQGVNSLIEFLDARNQLTASQLQRSLRGFELLTALVRLERETASYPFEN
jgi:outer membrane protein TolC